MTLRELYNILKEVGVPVGHYVISQEQYPYIIYQEYATTYEIASNKAYTEKTSVEVIHFSKSDFDPTFERLKQILLEKSVFFNVATTYDISRGVIQNQMEVEIAHEVGGVLG